MITFTRDDHLSTRGKRCAIFEDDQGDQDDHTHPYAKWICSSPGGVFSLIISLIAGNIAVRFSFGNNTVGAPKQSGTYREHVPRRQEEKPYIAGFFRTTCSACVSEGREALKRYAPPVRSHRSGFSPMANFGTPRRATVSSDDDACGWRSGFAHCTARQGNRSSAGPAPALFLQNQSSELS